MGASDLTRHLAEDAAQCIETLTISE